MEEIVMLPLSTHLSIFTKCFIHYQMYKPLKARDIYAKRQRAVTKGPGYDREKIK